MRAEGEGRGGQNIRGGGAGLGCGMTETDAYGPQISGDEYMKRPRSTGRSVPTLEVKAFDEEGNPLPPGEIGELCFKGPNLIRGYWNKPEDTAETIRDGWLHTGDLGSLEDGYLKITGRKKELIVTAGGTNIAPTYIEALLTEEPLLAQARGGGDAQMALTALLVPHRDVPTGRTI